MLQNPIVGLPSAEANFEASVPLQSCEVAHRNRQRFTICGVKNDRHSIYALCSDPDFRHFEPFL
jgi:hypothetical protein